MSEQTDYLRQQAERCRRLAIGLDNSRTANTILLMAADYEREANQLDQSQMESTSSSAQQA